MALFHRVRQRIVLTDDADRVYAADVRAAFGSCRPARRRPPALSHAGDLLNLALLPTLGTRWLIPRLGSFTAQHPDVTVNCAARTETV